MPTDLAIPFEYDQTGDAATVADGSFYEQHAMIIAADAVDTIAGRPLSANEKVEITSAVEKAFADSPYFSSPINAVITDVSDTEVTIEADVGVNQTIIVPVPLA